jgi:hypothetical protein
MKEWCSCPLLTFGGQWTVSSSVDLAAGLHLPDQWWVGTVNNELLINYQSAPGCIQPLRAGLSSSRSGSTLHGTVHSEIIQVEVQFSLRQGDE